MRVGFVVLFTCACGATSGPASAPPSPAPAASSPPASRSTTAAERPRAPCISVEEGSPPSTAEGTVSSPRRGVFVLRLLAPRCLVGVAGASVITEVMLASEGFDLRPLVGARIRVVGHALGDSDPEGPLVILVASDVERLPAEERP